MRDARPASVSSTTKRKKRLLRAEALKAGSFNSPSRAAKIISFGNVGDEAASTTNPPND
jgi:hypothetical protein